jgi:MYND finger
MSAVVEHTVLERITDGGIVMAESGTFQLAPLPAGFVPRRLGFAKDNDNSSISSSSGPGGGGAGAGEDPSSVPEYVPVTRSSRLAFPPSFTTKFKDKAVKKTFYSLANGEIHGKYEFKRLPDQENSQKKDKMCLVLRAAGRVEGTTLICVAVNGFAILERSDGTWNRQATCTYGTGSADERFCNALTLDEKEFLAFRVLHLFLRAMGSEILSFLCLKDAFGALDQYYSWKRYFEQTLDVYIIKADLDVGTKPVASTHGAAEGAQEEEDENPPLQRMWTLISVADCLRANVNFNQAGEVYAFIARSYGSVLSTSDSYANIHYNAGVDFRNGEDFNKSQKHLVAAWHALCQNNNSSSSTSVGALDINSDLTASIFNELVDIYQSISEEESKHQGHRAATRQRRGTTAEERREIVEVFPLLGGLLYMAGFQAGNVDEISQACFLDWSSQIAHTGVFRGGELDQPSALSILIQAGARPNAKHFRQTILQSKEEGAASIPLEFSGRDNLPEKEVVAKRIAKRVQREMKQRNRPSEDCKSGETCSNCGTMERPNGQPNFRCPCHKAAYCSRECQASHRKEHKKICTAPKQEK